MDPEAPKRNLPNENKETVPSPDEPPNDTSTGTLAPMNRVPFDIFQIIITMCQEAPSSTFRFTLSHVCRLWREYVLAMPFLWNSLHINDRVPCWEMLETSLKRSGQGPLDVYIGHLPFVTSAVPHLRKIMRMILPHLGRWRTLHLSNSPYKVRRILLDQIRAKAAPRLEDVALFENPPEVRPLRLKLKNTSPNWCAKDVFVGFPNLKSVEWTSCTPHLRNLPTFKNLKNLILGDCTLPGIPPLFFIQLIHRILSDSPSLETFKIHHYLAHQPSPGVETEAMNPQLPTITHHSLQTLIIGGSIEVRSAAMRTLILPKLRALSTDLYGGSIDLSCCDIISQEINLPELRVIAISGENWMGFDFQSHPSPLCDHMPFLEGAIRNLANLRVLIFQRIDFEGGRWIPDLGNCCPHLRWLLFNYCTGITIPSIQLLVETRMAIEGINPLEILSIQRHFSELWESMPNKDVEWFSKFLTFKLDDNRWYMSADPRDF